MRTFLVLLMLSLYMILSFPYQIFLLILKIFDSKASKYLAFRFLQNLSNNLLIVCGTNLHIEGKENLNTDNYLITSNHRSLFDTPLLVAITNEPISFVAKNNLAYFPFLNLWVYLIGGLFLDRSSIKKGLKTINKGIKKLSNGESMAIFPQGTRNKGEEFLPFKKGSFKLASSSGSKIVPVAIFGSDDIYENNGGIKPADVYINIFEPIETKNLSKIEQKKVTDDVEKMIYDKYIEYKNKKTT